MKTAKTHEPIRALIVHQGQEPAETMLAVNDFRAVQEALGNRNFTIEGISKTIDLILSDDEKDFEGEYLPNGCGCYGAYLFAAVPSRLSDTYRSLTDDEVITARQWWEDHQHIAPPTEEDID